MAVPVVRKLGDEYYPVRIADLAATTPVSLPAGARGQVKGIRAAWQLNPATVATDLTLQINGMASGAVLNLPATGLEGEVYSLDYAAGGSVNDGDALGIEFETATGGGGGGATGIEVMMLIIVGEG